MNDIASILARRRADREKVRPESGTGVAKDDGLRLGMGTTQPPGQHHGQQHGAPAAPAAVEASATEGIATPRATSVTVNHLRMMSSLGISPAATRHVPQRDDA